METQIQFLHEKTRKLVTVSNLTWLPNLGEQVKIDEDIYTLTGKVIEVKHEIYTRSGTHYITIVIV
jgi:hypothetical protein